jgi:hypothetical protein
LPLVLSDRAGVYAGFGRICWRFNLLRCAVRQEVTWN